VVVLVTPRRRWWWWWWLLRVADALLDEGAPLLIEPIEQRHDLVSGHSQQQVEHRDDADGVRRRQRRRLSLDRVEPLFRELLLGRRGGRPAQQRARVVCKGIGVGLELLIHGRAVGLAKRVDEFLLKLAKLVARRRKRALGHVLQVLHGGVLVLAGVCGHHW